MDEILPLTYTLAKLMAERDRCDQAIQVVTALIRGQPEIPAVQVTGTTAAPKVTLSSPSGLADEKALPYQGMKLWAAAKKLLELEGPEMGVTEMVEKLRQGGLRHISKNLCSNLQNAMAGKPDLFSKIKPGVYALSREIDRSLSAQ